MEQVKPPGSGAWALPKFGKRLTIAVGDPIDTRPVLESLLSSSSSSSSCQQLTKDEVRSQLTAFCRSQLEKVQRAAEQRHFTLT
jgi:hypothetical protein